MTYEEIQPDETLTGSVVFDVPAQHVSEFKQDGNVTVLQFSDSSGIGTPEQPVGIIRSYH